MIFKRIFSFFAVIFVMLSFSGTVNADSSGALSWYCPRNKEHKQIICAPELKFIEHLDGYYIDKKHGDGCEEKVIYLTFDAGYENGNIKKILDVMKEEKVTGAFFILGNLVSKNTELVKRMADEGHTLCNHTNSHKDMTKVASKEDFARELASLEELYREKVGYELSKYYRPPEGRFNEITLGYAQELGYKTIFWSFAYADWDNSAQMSADAAKKKIFDNIHNGAVILLHPTSATNAEILGEVIRELKSQGFRFGTLDELTAK